MQEGPACLSHLDYLKKKLKVILEELECLYKRLNPQVKAIGGFVVMECRSHEARDYVSTSPCLNGST